MKKYAPLLAFLFVLICIFAVWSPASIIQAIIPQVVPTPNKQGNGTKFQLSTGATTTNDCVKYDANGNTVDAGAACGSGGGGGAGTTFFSSTTQAGPSNTAAETSVIGTVTGSTTIPANTFANGTFLQVSADGYFTTPVTSDALTIRLKCGSTVLGSATLTPTINTTNGTFRLNLGITGIGTGASGAFITNGRFELTGVANPSSSQNAKVLNTTNVPFDFTTACAMDVTAQFAGATAGESITGTNVAAWLPGAAAGGGNTIATGTCATLPTSGQTIGNLFKCTDFPLSYFFTSTTAAQGYFQGMPVTDPPACAAMTVVNGFTCVHTANGPLTNAISNTAACCSNQLLVQSAPSTPYSFTTELTQNAPLCSTGTCGSNSGYNVGLTIRDSATGKFVACEVYSWASSVPVIRFEHWNSPTSDAGTQRALAISPATRIGLKIRNDGTNISCAFSFDAGQTWDQIYSESSTAFLTTPDQVGFLDLVWGQYTGETATVSFFDFTPGS